MSLIRQIQQDLIETTTEISPILLKLRFLASRLGSEPLEEWVQHETEGYPNDAPLPNYRTFPVSYTGTFSGPFNSAINNAPIPTALIQKFCGEEWVNFKMRQSIAAVDNLIQTDKDKEGSLIVDSSNLIMLIQGKIYPDYACNSVRGRISIANLVELQNAVKSRILELTLKLEKEVPSAVEITIEHNSKLIADGDTKMATEISNQVIHGNVTNVTNHGNGSIIISANNITGDKKSLEKTLIDAGIAKADATEFTEILSNEPGGTIEEPLGSKAKQWVADNIRKAVSGTWKIGISAATKVMSEAALKYYGLK